MTSITRFATIWHEGQLMEVELGDIFEVGGKVLATVTTLDGSKPFQVLGRDYELLNGARRWMPSSCATIDSAEIIDIYQAWQPAPGMDASYNRIHRARCHAARWLKLSTQAVTRRVTSDELIRATDAAWRQAEREYTRVWYEELHGKPAAAGAWLQMVKQEVKA